MHHGTNDEYLDRNYGGVLIIWDRMFGTFEPEGERVIYGLTKNVNTYNVAKINAHEVVAIWRDVKNATKFRQTRLHIPGSRLGSRLSLRRRARSFDQRASRPSARCR